MQKQILVSAVSILILVQACPVESNTPSAEPIHVNAGAIAGKVLDVEDKPVAGAIVVLCDQDSGVPVCGQTFRPFTGAFLARKADSTKNLVHAVTDGQGCFSFENVPAGEYRLLAQSWRDARQIKGIFEKNGEQIELHGVAEHIAVSPESLSNIVLRPLGTGVLRVDEDMPNDETLLVISTSPTRADPILGFAGWTGAFMRNMIGGNRMPGGKTTVYGLPAGTVYVAMFAADSVPGWTEGQVEIKANTTTVLEYIPFVNSWSNSRHDPPEKLRPLFEEIKSIKKSDIPSLGEQHPLVQFRKLVEKEEPEGAWAYQQIIVKYLDRQFDMPYGRKVTFGDIAAAAAYVELQQTMERKKQQWKKQNDAMKKFSDRRAVKEAADQKEQAKLDDTIDVSSPSSFFPDDPDAGEELDELWAVKNYAFNTVSGEEILEIVRKGFRRTSANKNDIIRTIGGKYIWYKSPSEQAAVDILYCASFDSDVMYDAFYYGLTVARPKSPEVLKRLADLAMQGYGVGRTAWGVLAVQDQRQEFLSVLTPYLNSSDPIEVQQARNIIRVIEGKSRGVYDTSAGETKPENLEKAKADFGGKLGQIKQTLLTGKSPARFAEFERICSLSTYLLFDDTFIPVIQACAKDQNAGVRIKTAEIAGYYWIWGDTVKNPQITQSLIELSGDEVPAVRFAAIEKGLFNVPDKSRDIIQRIVDTTLADQKQMPEKLYGRMKYVLRVNGQKTRTILQEYLEGDKYDRGSVATLYRDALRSEPPIAGKNESSIGAAR